jgi:peptide/nickel transport system permease protein
MSEVAGALGPGPVEVVAVVSARRFSWLRTTLVEAWRLRVAKIGALIVLFMVLMATFGPLIAPYSPTELVTTSFAPPSSEAWLGGDSIGRDVLTRVLYGGRTVITLALAATSIGMVLGVTLGLIAGYARRAWDETIMRLLDVVLSFPQLVLTLLFVSILGPRLWLIVLLTGVSHAPRIARVTRAATVDIAQRDFVHAAESFGVARRRILFGDILPNITSPLLVEFGLRLVYSIGLISALSFMGFGMQPPAADWGLMINENRQGVLLQPLSVAVPVLCIAVLSVGVNLIADGLDRVLGGAERDTGAG